MLVEANGVVAGPEWNLLNPNNSLFIKAAGDHEVVDARRKCWKSGVAVDIGADKGGGVSSERSLDFGTVGGFVSADGAGIFVGGKVGWNGDAGFFDDVGITFAKKKEGMSSERIGCADG